MISNAFISKVSYEYDDAKENIIGQTVEYADGTSAIYTDEADFIAIGRRIVEQLEMTSKLPESPPIC
jgi:hypothetical protein